jgi:hypothetical protein
MEPPFGTTKSVWATPREAEQLAYYSTGEQGVLAPRGWRCFGLYGSSGSGLHVAPPPFGGRQLMDDARSGLRGPAVEVQWRCGGTSGRFTVANFIAMVFPTRLSFALELIESFGVKPSDLHFGAYPDDHLRYRTPTALRYTTPAGQEGLGTHSWLKADDHPIQGVAMLTGEFPDLLHLAARLPDHQIFLAPAIMTQFERDAAEHPSWR